MSKRSSRRMNRGVLALVSVTIAAGALAGCTGIGSRSFKSQDSQLITGSTVSAAQGNVTQALPQALNTPSGLSAKYLPPADVGGMRSNDRLVTGSISPQRTAPSIVTQKLPTLVPVPSIGSTPTMPAQLASQPKEIAPLIVPETQMIKPSGAGYTHVISSGESLYAIARRYDVTTDSIVLANNLGSPDRIFVGQKITIPGATGKPAQLSVVQPEVDKISTGSTTQTAIAPKIVQPLPIKQTKVPVEVAAAAPAVEKTEPVTTVPSVGKLDKFRWPVSGKMVVNFAASKSTGINIEVPEGTAIRSAETGKVIYVGSAVEGYGNLILIKHDNGFVSAYAHLSQITVEKGDEVMRGDAIGLAGTTGSVSRPQLHFELRKGATPVDPVPLLAS